MSDVVESGIYEIINIVNNKSYIGSSVNLSKRCFEHFNSLKNKTHFNNKLQNSYNKYGTESFIFQIILLCDKKELEFYEDYCIREFKPELNLQTGAIRRVGDWKPSLETRKRMSESRKRNSGPNKGRTLPEWRKEFLRQVNLGQENSAKTWKLNLISPQGEHIDRTIKNLSKFCRERGIRSLGTFTQFLNGRKKSYGEWRLV